MKLLLNNKEIAHFLASLIDYRPLVNSIEYRRDETRQTTDWLSIETHKRKFVLDDRTRGKIKNKIRNSVKVDLKNYKDRINEVLSNQKQTDYEKIHTNIEFFIKVLGEETVLRLYKTSTKDNFVKSVGLSLDPNGQLMRRSKFTSYTEDCLIRNTVGNEQLIVNKIDTNYPFWFIDSGYTNFLETNKKWHRLERNHIHYGNFFDAPVDRLSNFKTFPQQWRTGGDMILIIEPGPFAAGILHVDLKKWKYDVVRELRQYTDKRIFFRPKAEKKVRTNLYKHLCNEDYYCVVNINSNAATEAIWAGIPVITLDKHITNPVTRSRLCDIEHLARPNLATWLSMLSYSQFTYEELINGTAARIVKQYHV